LDGFRRPSPLLTPRAEARGADHAAADRERDRKRRFRSESSQALAIDDIRQLVDGRKTDELAARNLFEHPGQMFLRRHTRRHRRQSRTHPDMRIDEIAIVGGLEQDRAVEIERVDNAARRMLDRDVQLPVRQVDEPDGQLPSEPVEVQTVFERHTSYDFHMPFR
jgi:hypothetical protein